MNKNAFDIQNIIDAQGAELALAGMLIVFTALTGISIFIGLLPKILPVINKILPEVELHTKPKARSSAPAATNDGAVVAAIAFAMHHSKRGRK